MPVVSVLTQFQLLDVVALKEDLPDHHLMAGQVGTLVEQLALDVYEVDFSDDDGQTYAMLPLHTSQLVKLHYAPDIFSAEDLAQGSTMVNTIHQHGSGDNIAGDKVLGDKVAGNKIGNQINGGNIASVVNEVKDQAQVVAAGVNQTSGVSTAELLTIIASLRQLAAQFPPAVQEDLIIDIDDVEAEIQKPEEQRSLPKLKKRLTALATAATLALGGVAGGVATTNDFVDNVTDLSGKLGIELPLLTQP